jgi:hypothetical protein
MNDHLQRRLAAILYVDVAGYSWLTADNEDTTQRTLQMDNATLYLKIKVDC